MHISIEVVAMIRIFLIFCLILFIILFRIGELDLAISDYSTALEIDSKNTNNTNF